MKAVGVIDQASREGNLFNRQFVDLNNELAKHPLLSGVLLEGVGAVNGTVAVGHRLARKPRGFIVVSRSANVGVWSDVSTATSTLIYVQADGVAVLSIWVF